MYQHQWLEGANTPIPDVGKIVCVGRNYVAHAKELGNEVPKQPVLFMKPSTALQSLNPTIRLRDYGEAIHYETELAVLIGNTITRATPSEAESAIVGVGLGLDLTFRETQSQLKGKGLPWERAKAFDGSCPMSPFVPIDNLPDLQNLHFTTSINGQLRQTGDARKMLFPISALLVDISQQFTLLPGDIVLTGTPEGVGVLSDGDSLTLTLNDRLSLQTDVVFNS